MGLVIKRKINEEYFLFVTGELKPGDCITIRKKDIKKGYAGYFALDCIEAQKGISILRYEHIIEEGGLESVIQRIKNRTFEFKTKPYI